MYSRRPSRARLRSGSYGSGVAHVYYGHEVGVTLVSIVCQRCGQQADARNTAVESGIRSIGHMSPQWRSASWQARCTQCVWREQNVHHHVIAQYPLFFASSYHDLWAWNREYLHWLLRVFERRDTKRDDYAYLRTYVPGHWQLSRRRYGRLAQRMLTT
jgi:hypothetical protein